MNLDIEVKNEAMSRRAWAERDGIQGPGRRGVAMRAVYATEAMN